MSAIRIIGRPDNAADLVELFWNAAAPRYRRFALWDMNPEAKLPWLTGAVKQGAPFHFAWLNDAPCAFAFAQPLCQGSTSCACHFVFLARAPREDSLEIGRQYLASLASEFDFAVASTPKSFMGLSAWLGELGFVERMTVPNAAFIWNERKTRNLLISTRQL